MKTKNYLSEAQNFLKRNTQVKSFDIVMHDCNGVGRGKIIRRNELLNLYKSGRQFPLSLLGMDITGEDTPETGLILEQGDGDIKAWPIPSSLKLLHNSKPPRGELFMNMYDIDGKKLLTDPRNILENKIQDFKPIIKYPVFTYGFRPGFKTHVGSVNKFATTHHRHFHHQYQELVQFVQILA